MFVEISSTILFGSLAIYAKKKSTGGGGNSDAAKIQKVFAHCGLHGKDGETCRLHRRTKIRKNKKVIGQEYVYQHPLGLCGDDFTKNLKRIESALNVKKKLLDFEDLINMEFKKRLIPQIKEILFNKAPVKKSVELDYDGMVRLKVYNKPMCDYYEYEEMKSSGWKVPIGLDRTNTLLWHDFDSVPHFLVAGATGGGKTTFIHTCICHLMTNFSPEEVKLTLIDLKGGEELHRYSNCKHVVGYAECAEEASSVLEKAFEESKNERELNKQNPGRKLKTRHFVIIDEIAELSPDEEPTKRAKQGEPPSIRDHKEKAWFLIAQLARLGRSAGVRLVSATQHPTQDVIPKSLKRNSEGKLCFRVEDDVASRVVLDISGAEDLPKIKGRAIYKAGADHYRVQTPLIKPARIKELVKPHIVIRSKEEEEEREQISAETAADRTHSFEFKKI